jgi:2-polyprenyl-6-methoxyphenol hydroxylase-like FAD-dependent oxidoreductase
VVGAGPAGSVTALLLARQGLEVLLLDRADFPRPKPCGDCLSAAATGLLDRLGLLQSVLDAGASTLSHWEIVAPDGTRAIGRLGEATALALERERLDPVLLDAAIGAGARFRQAHVSDLVLDGGRVRGVAARWPDHSAVRLSAPLVVGADGLRSVVARRLGLVRRPPRLRKVSLTAHVPAPYGGLRHGEMHVLDGGCVGYAPAGDGRCNLTVVVATDRAGALGELGAPDFFRTWLRRAPGLPAALHEIDPGPLLASGPFDVPTRAPTARGVALVGDASGYYDPFTGQGIHQALAGAVSLAAAVGPALVRRRQTTIGRGDADLDRALGRYARRKRRLTRPVRRTQRAVEWVLDRPQRADPVLRRLAMTPDVMDRLVEVTGDLRRPMSLLSPALVSSFIFPPAPEFP